jgi:hypothetical protein
VVGSPAWKTLTEASLALVADQSSDVVNAEEFEGRWAIRMVQQVRDFTTSCSGNAHQG